MRLLCCRRFLTVDLGAVFYRLLVFFPASLSRSLQSSQYHFAVTKTVSTRTKQRTEIGCFWVLTFRAWCDLETSACQVEPFTFTIVRVARNHFTVANAVAVAVCRLIGVDISVFIIAFALHAAIAVFVGSLLSECLGC